MALAFSAVVVRLVFVQGLSSARYATFGASQRLRSVDIPAERGSIFDRNHVELAMTIRQRTVWANPQLVRDPVADARALAPVLHTDENVLIDKLRSPGGFAYLARKVDDATADKVAALKIEGVNLLEEPKRFEPAGDLAASVLGQVGLDNQGLSGAVATTVAVPQLSATAAAADRDAGGGAVLPVTPRPGQPAPVASPTRAPATSWPWPAWSPDPTVGRRSRRRRTTR